MRVLQSPVDGDNPFFSMLAQASARSARNSGAPFESIDFSWRAAMACDYDVLHLHWPDRLYRNDAGRSTQRTLLRALRLLRRLDRAGIPIVRTVHGEEAKAAGIVERRIHERIDDLTLIRVVMSGAAGERVVGARVIRHGDYTPAYALRPDEEPIADRLLHIGRIRAGSGGGVDDLVKLHLQAVHAGEPTTWSLRIAGRPANPAAETAVRKAVAANALTALARFVDDHELATELAEARAVVLPEVTNQNSGAVLLALSAHRPVIVPDTPATRELAEEVGHPWVHRYAPPLTMSGLRDAWAAMVSSEGRRSAPDLRARDWSLVGQEYADVYRNALLRPGS